MPVSRLWDLARQVIRTTDVHDVAVTCSSHSVDIVAAGVSKLNVVRRLRETVSDEPILAIGDRGRWPGNDHELLGEPFCARGRRNQRRSRNLLASRRTGPARAGSGP